jgi:hypothetical protein
MMTLRRVRRQDPELQFVDEPVRRPAAEQLRAFLGWSAGHGPLHAALVDAGSHRDAAR